VPHTALAGIGLNRVGHAAAGKLPKAVLPVHLYGQSADIGAIMAACGRYGAPVIEDAAEALGATYWGAVARSETGHSSEAAMRSPRGRPATRSSGSSSL